MFKMSMLYHLFIKFDYWLISLFLPGHPAELSDSVKLLLTGAKSHVFEIDPVLKSIY